MKIITRNEEKFVSLTDLDRFLWWVTDSVTGYRDAGKLSDAEAIAMLKIVASTKTVVTLASGNSVDSEMVPELVKDVKAYLEWESLYGLAEELAKDFDIPVDVITID